MVYGIKVAKVGRRIRISSVWTRQTVILNCRASLSLECMSSPDGECRSVSYGFMKIRKSVAIVRKCKMGGCEHQYLVITWVGPIHSKISSKKTHKRGNWVVCSSRLAWDPEQKEHLLLKWWIGCTRIYKLRLEIGFSSIIKNARLECPGWFFLVQKNDRFVSPKWSPMNCPYLGVTLFLSRYDWRLGFK